MLAMDTTMWSDDVWVVDSTPVECGRSRATNRANQPGISVVTSPACLTAGLGYRPVSAWSWAGRWLPTSR